MDKFYVVETAITADGQANAVTVKDSKNEALMVFHQTRASALANPAVIYSMAAVLDGYGNTVIREYSNNETKQEMIIE